MSQRKSGYYWVRPVSDWYLATFVESNGLFFIKDNVWREEEFAEIDENPITKEGLEARDELIKEMVSDLSIIKTQLNLRLDKHSSTSTEDGIYLIISNLLTKAQSFNK